MPEPNAPRLLTLDDIPGVLRLSAAAGWNQTATDWETVLRAEPEGCFAIDSGGRPAATAVAVTYGTDLAWIGMVLTDPACRRRGFARKLMERVIAYAESRRVRWLKLDATDMGRPLYESLGFESESVVERWRREPAPFDGPAAQPGAFDFPLDRQAFGVSRAALLPTLAREGVAAVPSAGFATGRPGARAAYFGPCVARTADAARLLAGWFLARHAHESVFWDLPASNPPAAALAEDLGFVPLRRLARMTRPGPEPGAPIVKDDSLVFALAGFEFG